MPLRYLLALFAVAAACVGVIALSGRSIEHQKHDRAHEAAGIVTATISSQVTAADATLRDTAGYFSSDDHVEAPREFALFVQAALRRPGIRGISFARYVTARGRAAFEREHSVWITALGADRHLHPAPRRRFYLPVVVGASASQSTATNVGFDALSEPLRGAAIREALRTHRPAGTPPLRSVTGRWQPLIYMAVFRPDGRLQGVVGEALDPSSLLQTAEAAFPGSVGVRVLDGSRVIFSTGGDYSHAQRRSLTVAGRLWTVEVVSHASLGPAENLRWIVALGGILLLTTLFILFRRALRQTEVAERLVRERTAELDAALSDADTARAALSERNESLLELDRFKDRMLALISHDLRSPLTSIRGYVDLLLDKETGPLDADQLRFLDVIKRNAERLDGQIGDLLLVAGIAEGGLPLQRSAVDLPRVVMEAVETAAPAAREKGIELEAACQPLDPIYADGPRLAQVLDNLISNAIKYTPAGGRVDVRSSAKDDWISLTVTDTGLGMTRDELDSIFDPFFRTDDAKERGIKGTGLGLVIVKAIVEGHGGGVRVNSKPGEGSRFTVSLPIDSPAPWAPPRRLTTLEA